MITKEFLESIGYEVQSYGPEIRCICRNPYCKDRLDGKGHLYINRETGLYYCFRCETKGKIDIDNNLYFNNEYYEVNNTKEKINKISDLKDSYCHINCNDYTELELREVVYPYINALPIDRYMKLYPDGLSYHYLLRRGITSEEIIKYKMKFGVYGTYYDRILLPVFDDGKLMTFTARYRGNSAIKYMTPKVTTSGIVFNNPGETGNYIIVVEGIIDSISVARTGYHSIAMISKSTDIERLKKIKKIAKDQKKDIIFYLDRDVFFGSSSSIDKLYKGIKSVFNLDHVWITLPRESNRDPGNSSINQINGDIANKQPMVRFHKLSTELSKQRINKLRM